MEQNREKENKNYKPYIIWAVIIVIVLWGVSWLLIWRGFSEGDDRGTFGDMFGAVNALFSGLAFAGLIVTLLFQKEELGLQRNELIQTREELRNQRLEFEEQNKTLKLQRFENTFFSMLSLQQEIVSNIRFKGNLEEFGCGYSCESSDKMNIIDTSGREVFNVIYTYLIKGKIKSNGIESYSECTEISKFDHYFRHLYRIIKFVQKSELTLKEKYEYTSLVRAQLSDYELAMLFYNCLNYAGKEKFKPLVETYALLKNLRDELLVDEEHEYLYQPGAYKFTLETL